MYYCPDFDIDGQPRPLNETAEIGVDELLITNISEKVTSEKNSIFQISPNPFNGTTSISFELEDNTYANLSIYDLTGKKIQTLISEYKRIGLHELAFDAEWLENGVYFCVLKTNEGTQSTKLIKL